MEINIDRIKSRFDGKVRNEEIIKLYNQFKKIDDVLSLDYGIEETIVKFLKCRLNIDLCKTEINQRNLEIKGYENEIKLLNRSGFDSLRQKGKLMSYLSNYSNDVLDTLHFMGCILGEEVSEIKLDRFRKKRDETNRNYNELNVDGNVSVSSNINSWV
jgi:hypothetical protein